MLALTGCSLPVSQFTPPDETGPWGFKGTHPQEAAVSRADFSVEVVRFTDGRRPRSLERGPEEQAMDVYDPDALLAGITTRLPALYEKYLAYKPRSAKHYKVEFDLRELRTEVLNGTFLSGPFGRYAVRLEIEATARRPDSQVVLRETYRFDDERPRKTFNGRSPSVAMDEARLTDLVDEAVRMTAMNFAHALRGDARRWHPEQEAAPVPTSRVRLVPQPTLTRATGSATAGESDLVAPRYAPDSIPAAQMQEDPTQPLPAMPSPQPISW